MEGVVFITYVAKVEEVVYVISCRGGLYAVRPKLELEVDVGARRFVTYVCQLAFFALL